MNRESLTNMASEVGEAERSPIARVATDAQELRERLLRLVGALAIAEGVLGDAYDHAAKADDAVRARVIADECWAFAKTLHSL